MSLLFDRTLSILQGGMNVRRQHQSTAAGNIANIDTPGYKARRADFGDALARARGKSPTTMKATDARHLQHDGTFAAIENPTAQVSLDNAAGRPDGNNVNLEQELTGMASNAMEYQALTVLMRRKFGMLRYAVENG